MNRFDDEIDRLSKDVVNTRNLLATYDKLIKDYGILDLNSNDIGIIGLFFSIRLDFLVLLKHIQIESTDWGKRYFFNKIVLLIYEAEKFYKKNNFWINEKAKKHNLTEEFIQSTSKLKKIRSYDNKTKEVRNKCSAHIHEDFKEYYDALILLGGEEYLEIILCFEQWFGLIIKLLSKIYHNENETIRKELPEQKEKILKKLESLKPIFAGEKNDDINKLIEMLNKIL